MSKLKHLTMALLMSVGASAASVHANDEMRNGISAKIIGGVEVTDPQAWPWMIALVNKKYDNYNGQFCGGALIAPTWVLTAAHCVYDDSGINFEVLTGTLDLKDDSGTRLEVKQVIVHPNYNHVPLHIGPPDFNSDIALIELTEAVLSPAIEPVTGSAQLVGMDAIAIGWGLTESYNYNSWSETLQQVTVPIVSNQECADARSDPLIAIDMLCAGIIDGGKDASQGDSGGPLMIFDGNNWKLAGIVSWGASCSETDCNYGVYTRVSAFEGFITHYVNSQPTEFSTGRYANNESREQTLSIPSAQCLNVSVTGETEARYDFITILDSDKNLIKKLSGPMNEIITISGSSIIVQFTSDFSITKNGSTVTISSCDDYLADLKPNKRSGWSAPLIVSSHKNCTLSRCIAGRDFKETDMLYASWSVKNGGRSDPESIANMKTIIYVNDIKVKRGILTPENADKMNWAWVNGAIGQFSPGTYTIKMVIDADYDVAESNEENNEYSYTFTVN